MIVISSFLLFYCISCRFLQLFAVGAVMILTLIDGWFLCTGGSCTGGRLPHGPLLSWGAALKSLGIRIRMDPLPKYMES